MATPSWNPAFGRFALGVIASVLLGVPTANATIVHQYTFNNGNANDSVGTAHGTLVGNTGVINTLGRLDLTGNIDGMGSNMENGGSYVDLPNNLIEPLGGTFSIETWFSTPVNPTYSFLWSFGISGSFIEDEAAGGDGEYIGMLAPHGAITSRGVPNAAIDGGWIEEQLSFTAATGLPFEAFPPNEEQQFIVTFDVNDHSVPVNNGTAQSGGTMKLYWNGEFVASQYIVPYLDLTNFEDVNSWIGRANWNDPLFDGKVNEFIIHDGVLTPAQVADRFDAGPVPVFQGAPGDVNGSGVADIGDWNIIKMNMFTAQLTPQAGDLDSSGFVDTGDFRIWKNAYLAVGGSLENLESIPEPAAALLLLMSAVFLRHLGRRRAAGVATVLVAAIAATPVMADTTWVGPSGGNYAVDANWLSDDGFPGIPDITFDNVARINGGTVNLTTAVATVGPWLVLEGNDRIVFNVSPGGSLTLSGNLVMDNARHVDSALNMTGGSLTADSFWLRSSNGSVNLSGNASMLAQFEHGGEIAFTPHTKITGPNVTVEAINQWGNVNFWAANSVYTAVITGPDHSTIKASREVAINGKLKLEFSGYTPVIGETWDLAYAGELLGGHRTFETIDASAAGALPAGVGFYQSIVPGPGGVGETLRLALIRQLSLTVNRATGEVRINNPGNGATDFNGYTLSTTDGALSVPAWNSLDDQNIGTFAEAAGPTNMMLKETATSSYNVNANTSLSLGNIYNPQPTLIGQDVENLSFTYTTSSGLTVDAAVNYTGRGRNNLVVTVDPATGQAIVDNESDFTIQIDGYSFKSAGGSLTPAGWTSLKDQGMSGWDETNSTANRLAEFNISSALTLTPGATLNLGNVMSTSSSLPDDLAFEFLLSDRKRFIQGIVEYSSLGGGLPGDFNGNGVVNGADLTTWRNGFGPTYSGADFLTWQRNIGATAPSGSVTATPEPTAYVMLASVFACGLAARNTVRNRAA